MKRNEKEKNSSKSRKEKAPDAYGTEGMMNSSFNYFIHVTMKQNQTFLLLMKTDAMLTIPAKPKIPANHARSR